MSTSSFVLWFVGRPASGKSTLAHLVHQRLAEQGITSCVLDSDELRTLLTPQPTYSDAERDWFYATLVQLAALLAQNGVPVLIAATGAQRAYRAAAYHQLARFAEIYVTCSLAACQARDPKGLYAQAQAGELSRLPGIDVPFEPPLTPALTIDTEVLTPTASLEVIWAFCRQQFLD